MAQPHVMLPAEAEAEILQSWSWLPTRCLVSLSRGCGEHSAVFNLDSLRVVTRVHSGGLKPGHGSSAILREANASPAGATARNHVGLTKRGSQVCASLHERKQCECAAQPSHR